MVGVATGAGNLKITGSLDTSLIERGFMRVKQGFASVKGFAASFNSDLVRMSKESKAFAKTLGTIAVRSGFALAALAAGAPAIAPALAKMGVAFKSLQRTLGEALAPTVNKLAVFLDKIDAWAAANPKIFGPLVTSLVTIAALKFTGVLGLITSLASWVVSPSGLVALGLLARIAGVGAVVGAGFIGAKILIDKTKEFLYEEAEQIPGTLPALRAVDQKILDDIRSKGFQPTPEGMISASERDRRFFLLGWWDAMWG